MDKINTFLLLRKKKKAPIATQGSIQSKKDSAPKEIIILYSMPTINHH